MDSVDTLLRRWTDRTRTGARGLILSDNAPDARIFDVMTPLDYVSPAADAATRDDWVAETTGEATAQVLAAPFTISQPAISPSAGAGGGGADHDTGGGERPATAGESGEGGGAVGLAGPIPRRMGAAVRPARWRAGQDATRGWAMTERLTLTTTGDRQVRVTRRFRAAPAAVFRAHTDPAIMQHCLTGPEGWTMPLCISEAWPGGRADTLRMGGWVRRGVPPDRGISGGRGAPPHPACGTEAPARPQARRPRGNAVPA
ncbi:MAG: hypothetical protein ACK4L4_11155 [Gemmobacter sp.]